jgi:plastocyanin
VKKKAMQLQRFIVGVALIIMLNGCEHSLVRDSMLPTVTRTGEVKDIVIKERLSTATVTANTGDEIRWINKRQGDVQVILLTPVMERLTCQRNFGGIMGAEQNEYTAKIDTNDTAGVCFRDAGELKFVVRAESSHPSGEESLPGTITIGSEAQVRPSIEKGSEHTAQSPGEELVSNR